MIDLNALRRHLNLPEDQDSEILAAVAEAAANYVASYTGIDLQEQFPAGLPPSLLQAAMMIAAHLYENREATIAGVSLQPVAPGAHELMAAYRNWSF